MIEDSLASQAKSKLLKFESTARFNLIQMLICDEHQQNK